MYAHSKVDHFDEEKSLFSCYRCDAGFEDEESIRKHFENCVVHDRKEPIIDRKMYVHEGKENSCLEKEYPYNERDNFYDGKEYEHEEKEDVHEEKKYVHEETENVHEVKEYIKEEQELAGFMDEASLRNHVEISSFHNKPDNCNMMEATKISLKRHSSTIHEGKKIFECSKCDMKYMARSTLKKHIHKIHENFTHGKKYSVSKGKQLGEIKPVSEENKANKLIEKGMKNYIIANPDGTFRCIVETIYGPNSTMCNAVFKSKNASRNATRHFQTVHEKLKPFECAVCKRCFSSKQMLMRHYAKVHYQEKQPSEIQPVHGGKKPKEIGPVHEEKEPFYKGNNHTQGGEKKIAKDCVIANANGTFECTICNTVFKNKNASTNATRHFQTVHEKLKPFECAVCKRCFSSKQMLMRHYAKVHNEEKQPSEIQPVHGGKKPQEIKPVHEEKEPVYKANNHTQRGEKKIAKDYVIANANGTFECTICNAVFNRFKNATRHFETVHEKIKPYECAVCKRCFSTKQVLTRHAKAHEGKNMCHFCDIIFFNFDQLKDHVLQFHTAEGKSNTSKEQIHDGKSGNYIEINETKIQGFPLLPNGDKPLFNTKLSKKKLTKEKMKELKIYQCNLCLIICSNQEDLKNHIEMIHVSGLTKTYLCEACKMSFLSEDLFTEHARIIHIETHENVEIQEVKDLTVHDEEENNFILPH